MHIQENAFKCRQMIKFNFRDKEIISQLTYDSVTETEAVTL